MKIEYKGMGMTEEAAKAVLGSETFDVRLYDRHEGYWIDIKLGATWAEAQRSMEEGTKGGTRYTEYAKGTTTRSSLVGPECFSTVGPFDGKMGLNLAVG